MSGTKNPEADAKRVNRPRRRTTTEPKDSAPNVKAPKPNMTFDSAFEELQTDLHPEIEVCGLPRATNIWFHGVQTGIKMRESTRHIETLVGAQHIHRQLEDFTTRFINYLKEHRDEFKADDQERKKRQSVPLRSTKAKKAPK